jgi:hypothetical protein
VPPVAVRTAPYVDPTVPFGREVVVTASGDGAEGAVMRPIEALPELVNHRAPSGPAVISSGELMLGSV